MTNDNDFKFIIRISKKRVQHMYIRTLIDMYFNWQRLAVNCVIKSILLPYYILRIILIQDIGIINNLLFKRLIIITECLSLAFVVHF